ncbi:ComEA family DNA-binding protein [Pseudomonas sp. CAM1A]|uniref:ComEA family DNA-binding protein n=1 Tax=Pseudomonas sp. CAM1A TaxID=3231717 RepID=UPI0039C5C563
MSKNIFSYWILPVVVGLSFSLSAAAAQDQEHLIPVQASTQIATPMTEKIDLNRADASVLQKTLNGIGKAKAEAIVAYREANGPFETVDELLEIKGVGKALLDRNRDKLIVE